MAAPTFDRADALGRLGSERFVVLVIGGGITGAGVALDAASRGLSTALVERDDFASGTSSKSSKLVHGGLRYLQHREFKLVYENLYERQIALRNAPHLVRILPFLIPILSKDGLLNAKLARGLGSVLWMYDLTGGARIGKLHRRIKREAAVAHMPTLRAPNVAAAYIYYDAQTDDARLTLTIARTAASRGAVVANHVGATGLRKDDSGRIIGATVQADGASIDIDAKYVVNATGVWSDDIRAFDDGKHPNTIRPAKGIHITVPWTKVRNDIAAIVPVPKDKRSIFVVPWGDFTYIGTTDTDYEGPLDDPECTPDDVDYLLNAVNLVLAEPLTTDDILGTWAGLRPLIAGGSVGEKTADLSRVHKVITSPGGLITVTGGKLTTYRRMAADTVDAVVHSLGRGGKCVTKKLRLLGATGSQGSAMARGSAPSDEHLARRYGSFQREILDLERDEPALSAPLVPGLPYHRSEAIYAVRNEMATTLDDVLSRRTRARLLGRDASSAAAESVAQLIAPELGWDAARIATEVAAYRAALDLEREAASLPEHALDESIGA
ncbi:MAG: glycerol-3-phosphate dehydrogenase/oxidase [Acidimicrobiia bacterium]